MGPVGTTGSSRHGADTLLRTPQRGAIPKQVFWDLLQRGTARGAIRELLQHMLPRVATQGASPKPTLQDTRSSPHAARSNPIAEGQCSSTTDLESLTRECQNYQFGKTQNVSDTLVGSIFLLQLHDCGKFCHTLASRTRPGPRCTLSTTSSGCYTRPRWVFRLCQTSRENMER